MFIYIYRYDISAWLYTGDCDCQIRQSKACIVRVHGHLPDSMNTRSYTFEFVWQATLVYSKLAGTGETRHIFYFHGLKIESI